MTNTELDVLYDVQGAVATITINRPSRLNAFTPDTVRRLTNAVEEAGKDGRVGVIVLTGAGDRAFSAGGDVSVEDEQTFTGGDDASAAFDEVMKDLYRAFRDGLKPVIARVDGYAIGGGHHLATCATSLLPPIARPSAKTAPGWEVRQKAGSSVTSGWSSA